ncbi:MAG: hypothetical protein AAGJ35_03905, partial [Myxococcota bacterium]
MAQNYFAMCFPGCETALAKELRSLGAKVTEQDTGGVAFRASKRQFYTCLLGTRFAHRILWRVDRFRTNDLFSLFRKTKRLSWKDWLPSDAQLDLHVALHQSRLRSRDAVQRTITEAIESALGQRNLQSPTTDRPQTEDDKSQTTDKPKITNDPKTTQASTFGIWVRVQERECTLSLDAVGPRALYMRGWRAAPGRAPLRESAAALILHSLGWQPGIPLLDPMCGAGTFLLEAASIQQQVLPRPK